MSALPTISRLLPQQERDVPSTTITQYLFTNRGYIEKKERSQTNDHIKGKRVLMKSIEVKLVHTAPKRFISQKNFFN